jgi:glycerol-3-phosphate acyltransferase PlsY
MVILNSFLLNFANINFVIPIILAYLIGSISFSFLMTKWLKGEDIREHGSGNAGATNTLRVLGKGPAAIVLLLDAAKGVVSILLGYLFMDNGNAAWLLALCGMLVIIGHNWPIFLRFRGGKGVATTIGVVISLIPLAGIISGIIAIILIVTTRFVSLGSLVFTVGLPFAVYALPSHYPSSYLWLSVVIAILAIIRHKRNIKSLFQGTERKIGQKEGNTK